MNLLDAKAPRGLSVSPAFLRFLHDVPAPSQSESQRRINRVLSRPRLDLESLVF